MFLNVSEPFEGPRKHESQSFKVGHATPAKLFNARVIRLIDVGLSALLIVIMMPAMLVIGAVVYLTSPGPILFRQTRIGKCGKLFSCFKFRTMEKDAEERLKQLLASDARARSEWERDHKLRHDPRVTRIGKFLRKSSLDELPQLFNVLRGDMSFVGPRPIVISEINFYRRYIREYCSVRPGITGLWQVSGRNNVSYRRRVAMDVSFVRSRNIWLYTKIAFLTVPAVVAARGSY
jgi:exopolysaccharide production protein ExoY